MIFQSMMNGNEVGIRSEEELADAAEHGSALPLLPDHYRLLSPPEDHRHFSALSAPDHLHPLQSLQTAGHHSALLHPHQVAARQQQVPPPLVNVSHYPLRSPSGDLLSPRKEVVADAVPPLDAEEERVVGDFLLPEVDDRPGLYFLLDGLPDAEEQFQGVDGVFEVAHQEGQFGKLRQQVRQVKRHQFLPKGLRPHEPAGQLELREDDHVRKGQTLQLDRQGQVHLVNKQVPHQQQHLPYVLPQPSLPVGPLDLLPVPAGSQLLFFLRPQAQLLAEVGDQTDERVGHLSLDVDDDVFALYEPVLQQSEVPSSEQLSLEQEVGLLWHSEEVVLGLFVPDRDVLNETVQLVVLQHSEGQTFNGQRQFHLSEHLEPHLDALGRQLFFHGQLLLLEAVVYSNCLELVLHESQPRLFQHFLLGPIQMLLVLVAQQKFVVSPVDHTIEGVCLNKYFIGSGADLLFDLFDYEVVAVLGVVGEEEVLGGGVAEKSVAQFGVVQPVSQVKSNPAEVHLLQQSHHPPVPPQHHLPTALLHQLLKRNRSRVENHLQGTVSHLGSHEHLSVYLVHVVQLHRLVVVLAQSSRTQSQQTLRVEGQNASRLQTQDRNVAAQIDNLNKIVNFDQLHPINHSALGQEKQVVKTVLQFAEVEGQDLLPLQLSVLQLNPVFALVYQLHLYYRVLLEPRDPLLLLLRPHHQLLAADRSLPRVPILPILPILPGFLLDPEAEPEVCPVDYFETAFESDEFGFEEKSLFEDDCFSAVVILFGGPQLDDGLGCLVDHGEGVEVEGIAFVGAPFPPEDQFDNELLHVVVEVGVATQLPPLPRTHPECLPILTLLLHNLNLDVLTELVANHQKGHNRVVYYHIFESSLQNIASVHLPPSLRRTIRLRQQSVQTKLVVGHEPLRHELSPVSSRKADTSGIFCQSLQLVVPVPLPHPDPSFCRVLLVYGHLVAAVTDLHSVLLMERYQVGLVVKDNLSQVAQFVVQQSQHVAAVRVAVQMHLSQLFVFLSAGVELQLASPVKLNVLAPPVTYNQPEVPVVEPEQVVDLVSSYPGRVVVRPSLAVGANLTDPILRLALLQLAYNRLEGAAFLNETDSLLREVFEQAPH